VSYRPRVVDQELRERLTFAGAVVVEGPKACGKTETAMQFCASSVAFDIDPATRDSVAIDPRLPLAGATPRLLDEWQLAPAVWNGVRREVDARQEPGQFILTGSATPHDDITRHSGAGRISHLRMRPMSLFEVGASDGTVSIAALLRGEEVRAPRSSLEFVDVVEQLCQGGWPGFQAHTGKAALRLVADYVDHICRTDIHTVDGIRRDPVRVRAVFTALARHVSSDLKYTTLARDAAPHTGSRTAPDVDSVSAYVSALERLLIAEPLPAWAPHLRSRTRVRTSPKFHFVDPSLAVAGLGANPEALVKDLNTTGLLFESLVVRDLRVYSQPLGGSVQHYRDESGLEVDAIVSTSDSTWMAAEVKLSSSSEVLDAAAAQLIKFAERVDTARCGKPAALVVITASGYAYRRPDGVTVMPIGALGP